MIVAIQKKWIDLIFNFPFVWLLGKKKLMHICIHKIFLSGFDELEAVNLYLEGCLYLY